MARLTDRPTDEELVLLRAIAKAWRNDRRWPIWQYVQVTLLRDGLDALEILQGLTTWQHNYRAIRTPNYPNPRADEPVSLTLYGIVHLPGGTNVRTILEPAFLAALAIAVESIKDVEPDPHEVVTTDAKAVPVTQRVNFRAGVNLSSEELHDVLQGEPATWGGLDGPADAWTWDLTRPRLLAYQNLQTGLDYLAALEREIGVPAGVMTAPAYSSTALVEAIDHLDLAWRLVNKSKLVETSQLESIALLALPPNNRIEFEARCTALADLIARFKVPATGTLPKDTKSITRLDAYFEELSDDAAAQTVEARQVLRDVTDVRNSQQHTGSRHRYDSAWTRLGLDRFPADWPSTWAQVADQTITALATLRQPLIAEADRTSP